MSGETGGILMRCLLLVMLVALVAGDVWGQQGKRDPHLGYLYPAGGRAGTTVRVTAGGQGLRGATGVLSSGSGLQARVVEYIAPLSPKQLGDVAKHLRALAQQRTGQLPPARRAARPGGAPGEPKSTEELPPLPDHPLLRDLDRRSLEELRALRDLLFNPKKQPNRQLAETVMLEVTIAGDASLGDRELRLLTPAGVSNPLVFEVGALPEVLEVEPNDPGAPASVAARPPVGLPVVLNGQIQPGDVDRFRIRAQAGQKLVIQTHARRLIPYLADAVPGWFQATAALYDPSGKEVAYADDYQHDPDPVLYYEIPRDGDYTVEVRDALYRGRDDFVYRIEVSERPFVTSIFPLGGRAGSEALVTLRGWNLPPTQIRLDTTPAISGIRHATFCLPGGLTNEVSYQVDDLPEKQEMEPNDVPEQATPVSLPCVINGEVGVRGDVDVFAFRGRAGEIVTAEIHARRLGSPLDGLLRLTDASGVVLDWNDDHEDREMGLCTHHADPYLSVALPQDGVYRLQLLDSQGHGGEEYAYRLRIGPPRPDFALRLNPSGLALPSGFAGAVRVHVLRRDGFQDAVELALRDAPAGFTLQGGRIPAGRDSVQVTLSGSAVRPTGPVRLRLEGRASIGGVTVIRPVVPCEDMQQAFSYQHLVPCQDFVVAMTGPRWPVPPITLLSPTPVAIPAGGTAQVRFGTVGRPLLRQLSLELVEAPVGLTLQDVQPQPGALLLTVGAQPAALPVGYADNLVVAAFTQLEGRNPKDGKQAKTGRVRLGVLPAIPFVIAQSP